MFILQMNICSLPAHFEQLEVFLEDLRTVSVPIITGLCKTWLNFVTESLFSLNGYNIISIHVMIVLEVGWVL